MLRHILILVCILTVEIVEAETDELCYWNTRAGAIFDLRSLTITESSTASCYQIRDGDQPCTPEIEPSYDYAFNFCSDVTSQCLPTECSSLSAAAVQWYTYDKAAKCYVIGKYDATHDDATYTLIDNKDPTVGVSLKYRGGDSCVSGGATKSRTVTIDLFCADVTPPQVHHAEEPDICDYHITVNSVKGCPTQCSVTSAGLCNGHGKCMYDSQAKSAYCYCNSGYGGSACTAVESSKSYDGFSVQLGLTIVLLLLTMALLGAVGYFTYTLYKYRKEAQYVGLETEMAPHDDF